MTIDLKEYQRLQKAADDSKAAVDRAEGAMATLLKQLEDEFGCKDAKAAKALLSELEGKRDKAETDYETELAAFKEKWPDLVEG